MISCVKLDHALYSINYSNCLLCVDATVCHKQLNAWRGPGQLCHPRTYLLIQALDSLLEQGPLLGLEARYYSVVVSDDQHDIFPQNPQLLALLVDLSSIVRYLEPQPLPVVHLTK